MDVKSYLLEHLETHKQVSIPDLGTLFRKKIPGRYDIETHSFLPPKFELQFKEQVEASEQLADFISSKEQISLHEAQLAITTFVDDIKAKLAENEKISISKLGHFTLSNGMISFISDDSFQSDFEFFGLPTVKALPSNAPEISTSDQNIIEQESSSAEPIGAGEVTEIQNDTINSDTSTDELDDVAENQSNNLDNFPEKATNLQTETPKDLGSVNDPLATESIWQPTVNEQYVMDDDDDDENKGRGMRIFLKSLIIVAIVGAISVLAYFLYPDYFNSLRSGQEVTPIEEPHSIILDTNEQDSIKIDTTVTDSLKSKLTDTASTLTPNVIVYEVIGSAMRTQKKLDQVMHNFRKVGLNPKQLAPVPPSRLFKISLGTFTDFNLAKKHQDSLRIKLRNPDIYIQTIKPKN